MVPSPISENPSYQGANKLRGIVAIITGGDSGIGRAVAIAFAKEGADVVIVYLYGHEDAEATRQRVEQLGQRCLAIACDLQDPRESPAVMFLSRCNEYRPPVRRAARPCLPDGWRWSRTDAW